MLLYDFEYDGIKLSDKGYMICSGSGGIETSTNGAKINFVTVPIRQGQQNEFITSNYTECVTATFSICKKPCDNEDIFITLKDFNNMAAWLNRRKFHIFKVYDKSYGENICFNASFNVTKQETNGKIYAMQLEMITDRPHAFLEEKYIRNFANIIEANTPFEYEGLSNEEGYTYISTTIMPKSDGDLILTNNRDPYNNMIIKNCISNEIIDVNYPMITTDESSHNIFKDFNWNFPKLINTYDNKINTFQVNMRCRIGMTYYPIVKIGM